MTDKKPILLAGGYGLVGRQVAKLIRQQHPDLSLLIAGRNLEKAELLANELGNSQGIQLDVEQPNPLKGEQPSAIVAIVNAPYDYLLLDAVNGGIPYLDVTRWPERLRASITELADKPLQAPVLFASGWMGGIASVIAVAAAQTLAKTERIDISVLFSLKDKSGPNSVEYMDRLAIPFKTMVSGQLKSVLPYTDPHTLTIPNGYTTSVYRYDTPDQMTLPQTTEATTVTARIAFDDAFSTNFLRFLTRSGIWRLISSMRFTALRRSLLYSPGRGASHEIHIAVTGKGADNASQQTIATIVDPQGQTHLTALGALIQLDRLLGLDGAKAPNPAIVYPDTAPQIDHALRLLAQFGVTASGLPEADRRPLQQHTAALLPTLV